MVTMMVIDGHDGHGNDNFDGFFTTEYVQVINSSTSTVYHEKWLSASIDWLIDWIIKMTCWIIKSSLNFCSNKGYHFSTSSSVIPGDLITENRTVWKYSGTALAGER